MLCRNMNNLTKLPWNPDIFILISVSAKSYKSRTNLCLAGEEKSVLGRIIVTIEKPRVRKMGLHLSTKL